MESLETYFAPFRNNVVGLDAEFETPYGLKKIIYADWIASGRLYAPIERRFLEKIGPYIGNTHTETSETGTRMTHAYHLAHKKIKEHVNAGSDDVIITAGNGMTSVINKLQRILGMKGCGTLLKKPCLKEVDKPVVFITHMEHHSNQTSWYETICDVVVLEPGPDLLVNPEHLRQELKRYKDRPFKIGSFSACSNVTGVFTPYHELARIMHEHGGICLVDFAASAPYADMNMNPGDPMERLDAIMFSPHKFLGGPGSSGVLIFNKSLYNNIAPDDSGGGTVDWTNPWGNYKYVDDIEAREDGGTPGFLQAIKTALAIDLKNQMGTDRILQREEELLHIAFPGLRSIPGIEILASNVEKRLGVISFYHPDIHYNLFVKLLNDRFGIQMRGGCACAGTYGHYLLEVSYEQSKEITDLINSGDLSRKPGWVRWSLHPTMTDAEVRYILDAIQQIVQNIDAWKRDYIYHPRKNEFTHQHFLEPTKEQVEAWFTLDLP
jgi:selenocysteine lyase/cysteine desulfurase